MPPEVLLPLFALTLLANALLVAAAIRGLRRGRADAGAEQVRTASRPAAGPAPFGVRRPDGAPAAARPEARQDPGPPWSTAEAPDEAGTPAPGPELVSDATRPRPTHRTPAASSLVEPALVEPPAAGASAELAAPDPAEPVRHDRREEPATAAQPAAGRRRRTRRKFSMPPLEEDAKVERSIESFLAGAEAGPEPGSSAADRSAGRDPAAATTVAVVAISGLDRLSLADHTSARGSGVLSATPSDDPATIVERTLRGAARGTDEVIVEGAGRFRIVLRATGELAARAYLRRIRATVEPLLETFEGRLHLVTATATVLDEPLEAATATAERRLAAALAAIGDAAEMDGDPRAAAD
jgi:hypothetical protein